MIPEYNTYTIDTFILKFQQFDSNPEFQPSESNQTSRFLTSSACF